MEKKTPKTLFPYWLDLCVFSQSPSKKTFFTQKFSFLFFSISSQVFVSDILTWSLDGRSTITFLFFLSWSLCLFRFYLWTLCLENQFSINKPSVNLPGPNKRIICRLIVCSTGSDSVSYWILVYFLLSLKFPNFSLRTSSRVSWRNPPSLETVSLFYIYIYFINICKYII